MPSSSIPFAPAAPSIGTMVDGGNLQLVSVLGVGGYGVVYKAIPTRSGVTSGLTQKTYAVKCLVHSPNTRKATRQRELHLREITLHRHASEHPGVITLHRVFEQDGCTLIVMDYAPSGDLFTQILNRCTYLGDDLMIKDVFLQLLDAVQYCHSEIGVFHRDLKPENVLCFEDGARIAITDFGLATTDCLSEEYKTGSVYHMSPECQGAQEAYSPLANDVWSLGIILLNLATGRNPWKSATRSDSTFLAYLQDPLNFLPTVLPISQELNAVLVQMLNPSWRQRPSLDDIRDAISEITSFYSDAVVFAGSMAQCPWEAGLEVEESTSESEGSTKASSFQQDAPDKNHSSWSDNSAVSSTHSAAQPASVLAVEEEERTNDTLCDMDEHWVSYAGAYSWPESPSPNTPLTPSLSCTTSGSIPSMPPTPHYFDATFPRQSNAFSNALKLDTNLVPRAYYDPSFSNDSSMLMYSAVESCGIPSDLFTTDDDGEIEMGEIEDDQHDADMEDHSSSVWSHPYNIFATSVWTSHSSDELDSVGSPSPMDCDTPTAWWPKYTPTQPLTVPRARHPRPVSRFSEMWGGNAMLDEDIELSTRNYGTPSTPPPAARTSPKTSSVGRNGGGGKKSARYAHRPRFWSKLLAACT